MYKKIFPDYPQVLESLVSGCKSLLDVGCGSSSSIKFFSKKLYCVGIDAFQPSIEKSKKEKIHNRYYKMNILDIGKKFKTNSFDCVLASNIIEHLTKKDGLRFLKMIEDIAKKKVIVYTPNGFVPQEKYENNVWQIHKSGWNPDEMRKMGYKVTGFLGWKPLRKEYSIIRFWPRFVWNIISDITQFFVKNSPKKAWQLLCVKELYK